MVLKKLDAHPIIGTFLERYKSDSPQNAHLIDSISDYLTQETNECPPIVEDQRYYGYALMPQLDKLKKRGDETAFYRAAEVLYKTSHRFYEKQNVMERCFLDAIELRDVDVDASRLQELLAVEQKSYDAMKKTVEQFGMPLFREFLRKTVEDYRASISRDYTSVFARSKHILLLAYAYAISPNLLESLGEKLEPVYYHLVTGDTRAYVAEIWQMAKKVAVLPVNSNTLTSESLYPAYCKEKKAQVRETHFPDESTSESSLLNQRHLKRYFEIMLSLAYYRMHVKGGMTAFLAEPEESDRELLAALQVMFELYPLDILDHDVRLRELVEMEEPYDLLLAMRSHLLQPPTNWEQLEKVVLADLGKSRRALDIAAIPIVKGYLYKKLTDQGVDLSAADTTLEAIALDALRRMKGTQKLANYLEGKDTLEEALANVHLEDFDRVRQQMILLSFLPVEHPFVARLTAAMSKFVGKSGRMVGHMCYVHAFQNDLIKLVGMYEQDPETDIKQLVHQILAIKNSLYYHVEVKAEHYQSLVRAYPQICLDAFDKFDTEVRLFVLETLLDANQPVSREVRNQAIRLGLSDSSKKVTGLANAALLHAKDEELCVEVYTTEKKAKVKEWALDAIRTLDNRKDIFADLLQKEKNSKFKALLENLIEADGQGPDASIANLGNLIDKRKLARIKWLPIELLPQLRDEQGNELGKELIEYILTQSLESPTAPSPHVLLLKAQFTAASAADFVAEVLRSWLDQGAVAKEKWVMPLAIALGDRRTVDTISQMIKEWTDYSRGALAAEGVRALSFSEDLAALRQIDSIKRTIKNKQVRSAAEEALGMAAANLKISAEELEDRLVTQLGFDASGKQVFSYGERTFTVKVSNELELEVTNDSTGKAVKNLPAPTQKDDQQLAEEARATFAQLKKDLKSMVKLQALRLEESLSKSRYWTTEAWNRLFVENVLMQKFAIGLIWGVYEDGSLAATFRYMDDGTFNTVDEDEYELPEQAQIGLVHPLELDEETLAGWRTQLEDYEISQPFDQLNRELFLPTEEELKADEVLRLPDGAYTPTAFAKTMEKYGWIKGTPQDAGFYYEFYKLYGNVVAELKISGASISYYDGMDDVTLESLAFYPNDDSQYKYMYFKPIDRLKLATLPARIFSETLYDVVRATGK
ncbi:DUF4132 domain-containing protein [Brevibacillus parabrevis]|uniref:DUF4132 domain-containing protein n=1 Tax=Brevibacillus parabrevis TaxID=54914 RepID=UPI002E1BD19B|nr:DUF4132 domain-containing protein [Brevibacillus parabrevis]